jgi:tryptophan 2,3-dioxygenase
MKVYNSKNIWSRFKELSEKEQQNKSLISAMRHYDYTVNVTWVMAHYNAAKYYILGKKGDGIATGGSDWQKYMHPKYQKRIFFPELWSKEEKDNWGHEVD